MLLAFFSVLLLASIVFFIIVLIWKFNKHKSYYAWIHLANLCVSGFISFGIMFLMAIGSTGHFVATDFEELMGDISMYAGLFASLTAPIGIVIAIVKGIKYRNKF